MNTLVRKYAKVDAKTNPQTSTDQNHNHDQGPMPSPQVTTVLPALLLHFRFRGTYVCKLFIRHVRECISNPTQCTVGLDNSLHQPAYRHRVFGWIVGPIRYSFKSTYNFEIL